MAQDFRIDGGLIDRERKLSFTFGGREYEGYADDTLASALLANGVRQVARSFKYHRPRGVFSAGVEEPNALVTIGEGAKATPNTRASVIELYDGLVARPQNCWPSLSFDIQEANDLFAPFLSAGFYYKTFMFPRLFWELLYEPAIRRAAGLGTLAHEADHDSIYDKGYLHCDVLVIGAGPAGLMAALAAGRTGAQVIIADDDFCFGGRLLAEADEVDGDSGAVWAGVIYRELEAMANVRCMKRTTIFGVFDSGVYGGVTHNPDHMLNPLQPSQTLWRIYARRAVLAAGASERSIAFGNNDRPGVMLASAVRTYANRFATLCGRQVLVFTNNDDGKRTVRDLENAGARVSVVDTRKGEAVANVRGRKAVKAVDLLDGRTVSVDCIAVSGGWSPNVQLTCHKGAKPVWREDIAAFVPDNDRLPDGMAVIGAAAGVFSTRSCLQDGAKAGETAAVSLGYSSAAVKIPTALDDASAIAPFWWVRQSTRRAWVDLQNDVTVKDIQLAEREGFQSVEHVKRYTTLGMGTDQGKTSNLLGIAVLAEARSRSISETGTTVFRPPYTPVSIAALAGAATGKGHRPRRVTPGHDSAAARGAHFMDTGLWTRAEYFPINNDTDRRESAEREVRTIRSNVGVCDVSTLGKIDVQGADAAEFLNRVYVNAFAKLAIGRCRYGLMLREDGFAMDDGTVARLGEYHFVITTTTDNAPGVYRHLEFGRQCLWPALDVELISVTEQWAQYAIAGPKSRALLGKIVDPQHDISNEAFPFMACMETALRNDVRARLFRLSFSGELAYELSVPARYGSALFDALLAAGDEFGAVPYGLEAMDILRIEKGHVSGPELNGQTTALDLGLGGLVSKRKDCIGKVLSQRNGLLQESRRQLVGVKVLDAGAALTAGAHFVPLDVEATAGNEEGYLSSVAYSPTLNGHIGLGLLTNGAERFGDRMRSVDLLRGTDTLVEICSPHFVDPDGERLRG